MRKYLLFLVIASLPVQALAGPFGLEAGTPLNRLKVVKKTGDFIYEVQVPQPHSAFERYMVYATPQHGLCKVLASTPIFDNDRYGERTKQKYQEFKTSLSGKYGAPKEYDFLQSGALWKDSDEWTMSLRQKERVLTSFWTRENGATLPDDLESINLDTAAISLNESYVLLSYEFRNFPACRTAAKSKQDEVL